MTSDLHRKSEPTENCQRSVGIVIYNQTEIKFQHLRPQDWQHKNA